MLMARRTVWLLQSDNRVPYLSDGLSFQLGQADLFLSEFCTICAQVRQSNFVLN
jgi:hypothetical protein